MQSIIKNCENVASVLTHEGNHNTVFAVSRSLTLRLCLLPSLVMAAAQPHTADEKSATSSLLLLKFFLDVTRDHIVHGLHPFGLLDLLQPVDVVHT
jgi:hypothetical protein